MKKIYLIVLFAMLANTAFAQSKNVNSISLNRIKKDLIGFSVKGWSFDSLNEFIDARVLSEIVESDYQEKTVKFKLQGYDDASKIYYMKLLVTYKKRNGKWELLDYKLISLNKL